MTKMTKKIPSISKQNLELLNVLAHCKDKIRKAILINGDKDLIEAICQCIYNLLQGNIEISEDDKKRLYKYRNTLRKIVSKSSLKQKKSFNPKRRLFTIYYTSCYNWYFIYYIFINNK